MNHYSLYIDNIRFYFVLLLNLNGGQRDWKFNKFDRWKPTDQNGNEDKNGEHHMTTVNIEIRHILRVVWSALKWIMIKNFAVQKKNVDVYSSDWMSIRWRQFFIVLTAMKKKKKKNCFTRSSFEHFKSNKRKADFCFSSYAHKRENNAIAFLFCFVFSILWFQIQILNEKEIVMLFSTFNKSTIRKRTLFSRFGSYRQLKIFVFRWNSTFSLNGHIDYKSRKLRSLEQLQAYGNNHFCYALLSRSFRYSMSLNLSTGHSKEITQ